jgi:hypothetical protein
MAVWSALLLAPFLTLSNLSLTYALVPRSCDAGTTWMLHAVTLASAVLSAAATVGAWRHWMGGLFPPHIFSRRLRRWSVCCRRSCCSRSICRNGCFSHARNDDPAISVGTHWWMRERARGAASHGR